MGCKVHCHWQWILKLFLLLNLWQLSARWQNPYSGYKQLAVIVSSEAEQCRQKNCKLHVCDQHVTFLHEDYGWLLVKYHNGKQILVDGEKECRRTLLTCEIWKISVSNYSSIRRGRCKDPRASDLWGAYQRRHSIVGVSIENKSPYVCIP